MENVYFGNTGIRVSRLAIGTGTHGWGHHSEQTALGIEGLSRILQEAHELGINFWDLADQYGSHPHAAHALQVIPREQVVIATKTESHDPHRVQKDIERFLRELHTDVIDILLLHFMTQRNWPQRYEGAMTTLSRAQEAGYVRAVGVSCHGFDALSAAAENSWAQVVLVRINYAGTNMDDKPEIVAPVIQKMYEAGKAVYGMKVLGCGRLKHNPRKAIEYVLNLGTVHAMTIGTSNKHQLDENAHIIHDLAPLYPLKDLK